MIFVIGGLVEADDMDMLYDSYDDILNISYRSVQETQNDKNEWVEKDFLSIAAIEDPNGKAKGTDFRFVVSV